MLDFNKSTLTFSRKNYPWTQLRNDSFQSRIDQRPAAIWRYDATLATESGEILTRRTRRIYIASRKVSLIHCSRIAKQTMRATICL